MEIEYKGMRRIANQDCTVYSFSTNLRMTKHPGSDGDELPGLYALLVRNQDNPEWPYTVTKACVKYKKRGTGTVSEDGSNIPAQYVKKGVPLQYVEYMNDLYHFNLWMLEVIGHDGAKLIVRFWNSSGNMEVASFQDVDNRVNLFVNNALWDGSLDEAEYEVVDDSENENSSSTERQASYGYQQPNMLYSPDMSDEERESLAAADAKSDKSVSLAVIGFIEALVFAIIGAFVLFNGTVGLAAVPLVFMVLSCVGAGMALAGKRRWQRNRSYGFGGAKIILRITTILLAAIALACAAIGIMLVTHRLPDSLAWLYGVL